MVYTTWDVLVSQRQLLNPKYITWKWKPFDFLELERTAATQPRLVPVRGKQTQRREVKGFRIHGEEPSPTMCLAGLMQQYPATVWDDINETPATSGSHCVAGTG